MGSMPIGHVNMSELEMILPIYTPYQGIFKVKRTPLTRDQCESLIEAVQKSMLNSRYIKMY
jgi:hypothetical protein